MGNTYSVGKLMLHFTYKINAQKCHLHAEDTPMDYPVDPPEQLPEQPSSVEPDPPTVRKILHVHLPPTETKGRWKVEVSVRRVGAGGGGASSTTRET